MAYNAISNPQRGVAAPATEMTFSTFMTSRAVKKRIDDMVGGDAGPRFISSIVSAVSVNPALSECDYGTILSAALLGESLKLSPSPQLGQYYIVPFKQKAKIKNGTVISPERTVATFQLGYKGYLQLAIRSGQYKKLNVLAIKEGELRHYDPLNEEIEVRLIEDETERENARTIGYYAMFEYNNGFRKTLYWSREKMVAHADKYSQAFSKDATNGKYPKVSFADYEAGNYPAQDEWKYSSFWYKDFDAMAYKTMLRQLISKWGIMSIDLQNAMSNDMTVSYGDGTTANVDNSADFSQDFSNAINVDTGTGEVIEDAPAPTPAPAPVPDEPAAVSMDDL